MFITTDNKKSFFERELKKSFKSFDNCIISVGFLSEEKLTFFRKEFLNTAKKGQIILIYGWSKDATEDLVKFFKKTERRYYCYQPNIRYIFNYPNLSWKSLFIL